jgi:predicted ATP-dependent protease
MMPACDLLACCACHGGYLFLQVIAEINQQLQQLVLQAQQVSASGDSSTVSQLMELRTSIAKLAAVQQEDVVASIASMAEKVAANPLHDLTSELAEFSDVSLGII